MCGRRTRPARGRPARSGARGPRPTYRSPRGEGVARPHDRVVSDCLHKCGAPASAPRGPLCAPRASGMRFCQGLAVDQGRFVLCHLSGCPQDAVLAVQLCSEREARQAGVPAILNEPGAVLTISVEAESCADMSDEVMDGTETVVGTTDFV